LRLERYKGETVLAIGAHPDDVELGIGGTLARLRRGGARVVLAVVSIPGDYAVRRREAERGAEILGAELRVLIDVPGKRVEDLRNYELVALMDRQVRELAPAAVLCHGRNELHRDHIMVHDAAASAQRVSYFDFYTYQPNFCRPVQTCFQPRLFVDISETLETKMRAIEAHASQFAGRGIATDIYRDMARLTGRLVGVQYAEGLDVGRLLV
jgi:LmbE family N-acetylglucosaminyl deacetylase